MISTTAEGCSFKQRIVLTQLNFRDVSARYNASCLMKNYHFGKMVIKVHK
jgi:hypothetical protein